jgi:uncharacterized protein YbaR (Trm112 family)
MEFVFNCPHCHRQLAADESDRGESVACPACQHTLTIPHGVPPVTAPVVWEDDESAEVVEEFRLPQFEAPPPSHRGPSGPLPTLVVPPAPLRGQGPAGAAAERRRCHRYEDRPLQRRTFLTVMVITGLSCLLVAAGIVVIFNSFLGGTVTPLASTPRTEVQASPPGEDQNKLTPLESQELAVLVIQAVKTLPAMESEEAIQILAKVNQKQPTTQEQMKRFETLLNKGVNQLPVSQGQRLAVLLKKTMPPMTVSQ